MNSVSEIDNIPAENTTFISAVASILSSLNNQTIIPYNLKKDCHFLDEVDKKAIISICMQGIHNYSRKQLQPTSVIEFARLECSKIESIAEATCVGGVLQNKSINPILLLDRAKHLCLDIKNSAQGVCLGGYYSNRNINPESYLESAHFICKDINQLAKAHCLAGFLSNSKVLPDSISHDAIDSCKDITHIGKGLCIGAYISKSENPQSDFINAQAACLKVETERQGRCMATKLSSSSLHSVATESIIVEQECLN